MYSIMLECKRFLYALCIFLYNLRLKGIFTANGVPAIPGFGTYFKSTLLTIFGFNTILEGRRQRRAASVKANGREILRKEPD
jgi:hypothetical protein